MLRNGETYYSDLLCRNCGRLKFTHPYVVGFKSYTPKGIFAMHDRGVYDKDKIMQAFENKKKELAEQGQDIEGFVVRDVNDFPTSEFQKHVAKYVRANHVQTDKHWRETWTKNEF